MKSLKEIYNLSYDESGFNSGLIQWYNRLIDKSYDNLTVTDVSKMIRQNILKEVAINKALELFFVDPYDGEYQNGDLLNLITTFDIELMDKESKNKLLAFLPILQNNYLSFEWDDDESRDLYVENIKKLLSLIIK